MCSGTRLNSSASYLTSPAFPDGFVGVGYCKCTARPVEVNKALIKVNFEHVMLSDGEVCNEKLLIFKNGKQDKKNTIVSKCSPSLLMGMISEWFVREISVVFHRRERVPGSGRKTVVWIGIAGKFNNPLRAKFLRENINIYLYFMSFLHTNKTQVAEIPPRVRQGPTYSTWSISWPLMSWRRKEPGHQQPCYWPS